MYYQQMAEGLKVSDHKHLKISSSAFNEGGLIPSEYTCDGENVNTPLDISGIPTDTKSLAINVEDPDAPIRPWLHWLAWDIHNTRHIKEGRIMEAEGSNDFGEYKYLGPCPPTALHLYYFKVYALDTFLNLPIDISKKDLERNMNDHIIGFGETMGIYKRK